MSGSMIEFRANGRTAAGYLSLPASGRGPGIIVIQEWWGLVGHIKAVADRFAAAGFVALAPDMYHGESTTSPDDAGRMMMALDIAEAGKDLQGAANYLLAHEAVTPKKVAALGFCMGGQLAVHAATMHEEIAAVVDFYGIHPAVQPDFSKLRAPVLAHFGESDPYVDRKAAEGLVEGVRGAGGRIDAHFYPAGHAFFNDARPEAYDAGSAQLAWDRTLAFLRTSLA